jgi:FkbM family methyltransferase
MTPRDYSQAGETREIYSLLPKSDGYFVEVGAHDGISLSNTFGLIEIGWTGICIEANPVVFQKLQRNLGGYPVKLVLAAVARAARRVKLFMGKDDPGLFLSTICEDDSDWFKGVRSDQFTWVDGFSLTDILHLHGCPACFDLLSIDAEGMDFDILQGLDFGRFTPKLIVTENYVPKNPAKFELLELMGYKQKPFTGDCNTCWVKP